MIYNFGEYEDEADGTFGFSIKSAFTAPLKAAVKVTKKVVVAPTKKLTTNVNTKILAPIGAGAKSAITPLKGLANVKTLTNPLATSKILMKSGKAPVKAADKVLVNVNPLDPTLHKLDVAGIKAGGVGKILGNLGEKARVNPIETTAAGYALAVGYTALPEGTGSTVVAGVKAGAGYVSTGVGVVAKGNSLLNMTKKKKTTTQPQPVAQNQPQAQDNSGLYMIAAGIAAKLLLFS